MIPGVASSLYLYKISDVTTCTLRKPIVNIQIAAPPRCDGVICVYKELVYVESSFQSNKLKGAHLLTRWLCCYIHVFFSPTAISLDYIIQHSSPPFILVLRLNSVKYVGTGCE